MVSFQLHIICSKSSYPLQNTWLRIEWILGERLMYEMYINKKVLLKNMQNVCPNLKFVLNSVRYKTNSEYIQTPISFVEL